MSTKIDNTPLAPHVVRDTLTLTPSGFYVSELGEDGEWFIAEGYLTTAQMRTAMREYGADWVDQPGAFEEENVRRGWAVMTPHQYGCTGLYTEGDPEDGPCTCDQYGWWLGDILGDVAEANAKRPGAIAVTEWRA